MGQRDRRVGDREGAHERHQQRGLPVEDRRHHEQQHDDQADAEADERQRAAQTREHQHHHHEQPREQEQRTAPLEVVERVAGAGHGRRALGRVRRLGHADLVARVDVRVEASGVELDRDALAGLAAAPNRRVDELAGLAGEAGAEALTHTRHVWAGAVGREALGHPRLHVARPQRDHGDGGRNRERRRDDRKASDHRGFCPLSDSLLKSSSASVPSGCRREKTRRPGWASV
jgi:hypothetical protein